MLAKLQHLPIEQQAAINLRDTEISLDHYPAEIRSLFSPLKGRFLNELVRDFLLTLEVPVQPPTAEVNNFYDLWFSHY